MVSKKGSNYWRTSFLKYSGKRRCLRNRIMTILSRLAAILLLGAGCCPPVCGQPAKVLVLAGGIAHNYDELPRALNERLQLKLKDRLSLAFTVSKDLDNLRAEELSHYSLLMLNMCRQDDLTAGQKDAFLTAVRNGLPVVALHCTFWCFQRWPEFKEVLGAFVPGHQPFTTFCVQAAKPDDPILSGVDRKFAMRDEPYLVNDRAPSMNVLVKTCEPLKGRGGPEPEVWTRTYGKGRIFAMTFGHDARAQENPDYLTLLSNGILWALGK